MVGLNAIIMLASLSLLASGSTALAQEQQRTGKPSSEVLRRIERLVESPFIKRVYSGARRPGERVYGLGLSSRDLAVFVRYGTPCIERSRMTFRRVYASVRQWGGPGDTLFVLTPVPADSSTFALLFLTVDSLLEGETQILGKVANGAIRRTAIDSGRAFTYDTLFRPGTRLSVQVIDIWEWLFLDRDGTAIGGCTSDYVEGRLSR